MASTTLQRMLKTLRSDGSHEVEILRFLKRHGQKDCPVVFLRADNYQRLMNAVASASAVDMSRDRACLVCA